MSKARLDTGAVFERYETKYLLGSQQYAALMKGLAAYTRPDEYGLHTICTLYYDTDDYAVIRHCLDKPKFREKLRLRSYGVPGQNDTVYLELKKKMAGVTYKRRTPMALAEAEGYMRGGWPPVQQGQIFQEIDWFARQRKLSGKVVLCYDRFALLGKQDPALRITVDTGIRWRDYSLGLDKGDHGALLLPPATRLMEVKTRGALPCWLVSQLSALGAYPTSFSKYGTIYAEHLAHKEALRHAV